MVQRESGIDDIIFLKPADSREASSVPNATMIDCRSFWETFAKKDTREGMSEPRLVIHRHVV